MNKNAMIVFGGALLAALLVAMMVQLTMGGKKKAVSSAEVTQVLVAARNLKSSMELEEGDLKWEEWPEEKLFSGAILQKDNQKPEEALDGRLSRNVSRGEPMKRSMILKAKTGNFVAASLGKGERAVAIKVKPETMVAGFINPGSLVDVILTYKKKIRPIKGEDNPAVQRMIDMNLDAYAAETVIQKARVLALDQTVERQFDDTVKTSKTVTLAVSFRDAEKLALASKVGIVTLSLRGVEDTDVVEGYPAVSDARMVRLDDEINDEYKELKAHKKSVADADVVRVYNGARVTSSNLK